MKLAIRSVVALALVVSMGWAGSSLMSSPAVASIDNVVGAPVAMTASADSATAMSTLVAENSVGATIITISNAPLISGGLRGMRQRAGRLNLGAQNVTALNSMPGGWWFRHSCFVP